MYRELNLAHWRTAILCKQLGLSNTFYFDRIRAEHFKTNKLCLSIWNRWTNFTFDESAFGECVCVCQPTNVWVIYSNNSTSIQSEANKFLNGRVWNHAYVYIYCHHSHTRDAWMTKKFDSYWYQLRRDCFISRYHLLFNTQIPYACEWEIVGSESKVINERNNQSYQFKWMRAKRPALCSWTLAPEETERGKETNKTSQEENIRKKKNIICTLLGTQTHSGISNTYTNTQTPKNLYDFHIWAQQIRCSLFKVKLVWCVRVYIWLYTGHGI